MKENAQKASVNVAKIGTIHKKIVVITAVVIIVPVKMMEMAM